MKKRSQSFDKVAQIYDKARPTYPEQLIEDIIHLAELKNSASILDIGTGTGQGTIPFAQKGYAIHCLEPGPNLIAIAKQNMSSYPTVTFETVTFEDWKLQPQYFDLAISAQAFHWVDREIGYPKVAQTLKENGHIAFFWNFSPLADTPAFQSLNEAFKKYAPQMVYNPPSIDSLIQKRENWINNSLCFKKLLVKQYPWSINYDSQQYLNLLKTRTVYQDFNEDKKNNISNIVEQILNNHGGFINRPYLSILLFAQKK
ncbi:class I SAM-dependent methyltransferase [Mastigocoleus testarum]|uniref:Methyltransferase type 11 n=1 Tax=Mastigocoleus testarum BC008 TaxID=371196 RepID=A0A0V7ZVN3_9CYAN|nr:class I SAM-dependent methyltransferase [Mastigocoleus testarum]KST63553.1 methyltransferase type 11 [Mastigocoleus testarum BC008]KST68434.1 methyltransferase type 11 [Mastigocoleus testarum BC008]